MGTVAVVTRALEARDPFILGHAARVAALSEAVARRLGITGPELDALRLGARLHDAGKLLVSRRVLLKAGALDAGELGEIREHPAFGVRLIDWREDYAGALPLVLHHHERWDGGGYPDGLAGDQIPLGARILSVADAFDAMTTDRPYRHAVSSRKAVAELVRCSGSQFDPAVVDAFLAAWRSGELARRRRRGQALSA